MGGQPGEDWDVGGTGSLTAFHTGQAYGQQCDHRPEGCQEIHCRPKPPKSRAYRFQKTEKPGGEVRRVGGDRGGWKFHPKSRNMVGLGASDYSKTGTSTPITKRPRLNLGIPNA